MSLLNDLLGGSSSSSNSNSDPFSGLLSNFKGNVSTLKNVGPYILIGGAAVVLIILIK